jgi:hypothetical protein
MPCLQGLSRHSARTHEFTEFPQIGCERARNVPRELTLVSRRGRACIRGSFCGRSICQITNEFRNGKKTDCHWQDKGQNGATTGEIGIEAQPYCYDEPQHEPRPMHKPSRHLFHRGRASLRRHQFQPQQHR